MRYWVIGFGVAFLSASLLACGGAPTPTPTPEVEVPTPHSAESPVDSSSPPSSVQTAKPAASTAGPKVASIPGTSIRFEGGDGASKDHPIKILGASGEKDGVAAEYQYLELVYGAGKWKTKDQSLLEVNGKKIDQLDVEHPNGPANSVFFDISDYFGKF